MSARRRTLAAAAIVGCLVASTSTVGAAATPGLAPGRVCIPIILPCDPPSSGATPSPTPSDPATPGVPTLPLPTLPGVTNPADPAVPVVPAAPGASAPTTPSPVAPVPDDGAPVFTQPSAQLGAQSLSFSGLRGIQVVSVPLADGSRITALKLTADSITIDGFALTVRRDTGPVLATSADRMTLRGNVQVYVNSVTGALWDGTPLTLGADTPPPMDGVAPGLLRVTLGLVGATADSITYTNTQQHLRE